MIDGRDPAHWNPAPLPVLGNFLSAEIGKRLIANVIQDQVLYDRRTPRPTRPL